MDEKLDKKLCSDYPMLYRQRNLPMTETCLCWGFPGTGWYDLINELSQQLTAYATEHKITIEAAQVKEKFGRLCYYIDEVPKRHYDQVYSLIGVAEDKSAAVCELCGKMGEIAVNVAWIRCICPTCRKTNPWRRD